MAKTHVDPIKIKDMMLNIDLRRTVDDNFSQVIPTAQSIIEGRVIPAYKRLGLERYAALLEGTDAEIENAWDHFELLTAWLGLHFWHMANKPHTSGESIGDANESYQFQLDLFLVNTLYGQTAMLLDESGELKKLDLEMKEDERFVDPKVFNLSLLNQGVPFRIRG